MENMHVGAKKGTEIQTQLTRKVTPERSNRLEPVRREYTVGHVILSEEFAEAGSRSSGHRLLGIGTDPWLG